MKQMNADVIVVAAGLSGLAATVAAAEQGLKVITFEKNATTGGAANMGVGPLAVGTKNQRMIGHNLTPDDIFLKHMHYCHWRADARLVYEYYSGTARTIEWLEEMGVEFVFIGRTMYTPTRMKAFAQPELTSHAVKPPPGGRIGPRVASGMTKALTDRAYMLGAEILLETPGISVINENGIVVGVRAVGKDGDEIEARSKAVIIGAGGYGDNPKMIKETTGFEWGQDLFSFRIPGNVGDGLRMCWDAGAAKTKMMLELMYQIPDNLNHFDLEGAFRQPILWVNKLGERFMPEDCIGNTATTGNAIVEQQGHTCFSIMDEATLRHYKKKGVDFAGIQGEDVFKNFDQAAEAAKAEGYAYYFEADSVEELCKRTGIHEQGLRETLDEYNHFCEIGRDELFNKPYQFLRQVKKPRFYALQSFPGAYGTLGGVRINHKTQALNAEGMPVPGLYSVGTDACNIHGDTYTFILPGNTMAFCLYTGRTAGKYAGEYIASLGEP
jgi:fumarate reductase flavoprotein subunit